MKERQINSTPTVLTIAGSDPSAGAGIQADLKTIAAHNCYGLSVITALTVQNTTGVKAIYPLPVEFIEEQLKALFDDIQVSAVKIGMLCSGAAIEMLANFFKDNSIKNLVLDTVVVSDTPGAQMLEEMRAAFIEYLLPITTLMTPNIPEAENLLKASISDLQDMKKAAKELSSFGASAILLKGGHLEHNQCCDILYFPKNNEYHEFSTERIVTSNLHGTGCTLSSAISANLALGFDLVTAVSHAKQYLTKAIKSAVSIKIGKGNGPLKH